MRFHVRSSTQRQHVNTSTQHQPFASRSIRKMSAIMLRQVRVALPRTTIFATHASVVALAPSNRFKIFSAAAVPAVRFYQSMQSMQGVCYNCGKAGHQKFQWLVQCPNHRALVFTASLTANTPSLSLRLHAFLPMNACASSVAGTLLAF